VIGDIFSVEALIAVSGETQDTLAANLPRLIQLQIFEPQDNGYHFRHGLAQQAVYEELTRLQRQKLHLKTAEYYSHMTESEQVVLIRVNHLLKAGMPTLAMSVVIKAANQAEERGEISLAQELYARGLDIFPDDHDAQQALERLSTAP
jgi:predicted ATPase